VLSAGDVRDIPIGGLFPGIDGGKKARVGPLAQLGEELGLQVVELDLSVSGGRQELLDDVQGTMLLPVLGAIRAPPALDDRVDDAPEVQSRYRLTLCGARPSGSSVAANMNIGGASAGTASGLGTHSYCK